MGKGRGMSVGEFCGDMADSARNPAGRMFWCFWLVAGAIFTIVTLSMTIEAIDSTELGLPYDTVKCNLKREVKGEGMHFKTVYGQFIKWPAMYKRLSLEEQCNSKLRAAGHAELILEELVGGRLCIRLGDSNPGLSLCSRPLKRPSVIESLRSKGTGPDWPTDKSHTPIEADPGCPPGGCLFNLSADATEHAELSAALPAERDRLRARLDELLKGKFQTTWTDPKYEKCVTLAEYVEAHGGFAGPICSRGALPMESD